MRIDPANSVTSRKTYNVQHAALPYRVRNGVLEILLITTRRTHRWIVPKGWPIDGHPPHDRAAFEALEEAGISGEISNLPWASIAMKSCARPARRCRAK
jgi:8-oxo-dGTP pyrophosphatase MutT (NUDIX family)